MTNIDAIQAQDNHRAKRTYWLSVYTACQLHKQIGAPSFEEFLQAPWVHLEQHGQAEAPPSMAHGYEPLLPAQAAVARRLDDQEAREADLERQRQFKSQIGLSTDSQSHSNVVPLSAFTRTSRA